MVMEIMEGAWGREELKHKGNIISFVGLREKKSRNVGYLFKVKECGIPKSTSKI